MKLTRWQKGQNVDQMTKYKEKLKFLPVKNIKRSLRKNDNNEMSSLSFKPDELVVNYHDACVYGRDLALLDSSTAWLNDACIHFYLTFLQKQQQQQKNKHTTLFLDPSVISFLMHQCHDQEDLQEFAVGTCGNFAAPDDDKMVLMVPINDHFSATDWAIPGAGMHWSLLVLCYNYDKNENTVQAFHLDSAHGNLRTAELVARKIHSSHPQTFSDQNALLQVVECQVPRQQNGHDCGIHMLAAANALADMELDAMMTQEQLEQRVQIAIDLHKHPDFCRSMRRTIANQIRKVAQQQQQSAT